MGCHNSRASRCQPTSYAIAISTCAFYAVLCVPRHFHFAALLLGWEWGWGWGWCGMVV